MSKDGFEKVQLNEEQLKNVKLDLDSAELLRDQNDITEFRMEEKIKKKLVKYGAIDVLEEMKKVVETGEKDGVKLKPFELEQAKIDYEGQKRFVELDIPMRDAKLALRKFKENRTRANSPEMQIPKYKKALSKGYMEVFKGKQDSSYTN